MQIFVGVFLVISLLYIAVHHAILCVKYKRLNEEQESQLEDSQPTKYIMVSWKNSDYILDLAHNCTRAHLASHIPIHFSDTDEELGRDNTIFENGDQLLVYDYSKARIVPLSKAEINNYSYRLFFDNQLPLGAERAVIQALGLQDYMVSVGICSKKGGGK